MDERSPCLAKGVDVVCGLFQRGDGSVRGYLCAMLIQKFCLMERHGEDMSPTRFEHAVYLLMGFIWTGTCSSTSAGMTRLKPESANKRVVKSS